MFWNLAYWILHMLCVCVCVCVRVCVCVFVCVYVLCMYIWMYALYYSLGQCWRNFWVRMPQFSVYFETTLSRARGNFEEQNTVLEPSIIIVNNYIINGYYNCIVQLIHRYSYYSYHNYYYYTICMSSVTGISSRYFSWTSGDPHRSGFKLHIAVLSVLCVMFQV